MEFSWPVFIIGLLLGVLQLAMGVIIGRALPLTERQARRTVQKRASQLSQLAGRLFNVVHSVADDVGQHRTQMKQVNDELASVGTSETGDLAEVVLKTVAEIVQVNERLQNRLSAAEDKLHDQAQRIQSHIAEARTDALTGLPNRRAFDDELVRRIAEWQRKKVTFCLLIADVDHFKAVNDRFGHPAADEVLRSLAEVFRSVLRDMDLAARIGGEEFGFILPSTNYRDAMHAAQRLRAAVAATPFAASSHRQIAVTISLGLASVRTGDDSVSISRRADQALYASKRAGRDCGHYHDGDRCTPIPMCGTIGRRPDDLDDLDDRDIDPGAATSARAEADPQAVREACDDLRQTMQQLAQDR